MRVQIFLVGAFALVALAVIALILKLRLRKVPPGKALLITGSGNRRKVAFERAIVLPIVQRADLIDISVKTLLIEPEPSELLITKDNQRLSYRAHAYLRINKTAEDVRRVADALGCERASDLDALRELFRPKMVSTLRAVAHQLTYLELQQEQQEFQERVLVELGSDLSGYCLDELVVDRIERADPSATGPFR